MTNNEKTLAGFVVVFLSAALWPTLPNISLIACSLFILIFCVYYRLSAILIGSIVGFLWASASAYHYMYGQINPQYFGQNIVVEGTVVSIIDAPKTLSQSTSFTLALSKLGKQSAYFSPHIRVSWFSPKVKLQQGNKLRLFIKLKAPVGLANQFGFNYQQWLVSKNIVATAYVKTSPSNHLINTDISMRQSLINKNSQHALLNSQWINALMYGYRGEMTNADWALLQNTGTAHLFAVSGMHLGIVFGFSLLIVKFLHGFAYSFGQLAFQSHKSKAQQFNTKSLNLSIACIMCCVYAWLCGFEVPVVRALISITLLALLSYLKLYWRMTGIFLSLLSIFFVLFPHAYLGLSFWFSFIAVCLIWFFFWRYPLPKQATLWQVTIHTVKLQLFLCISTLPIIIWAFDTLPWVSFIANIVVIPIITFFFVPLCLIAAIASIAQFEPTTILQFVDLAFSYVLMFLNWINQPSLALQHLHLSRYLSLCLLLFTLVIALPNWSRKVSAVISGVFAILFISYLQLAPAARGEWHMYIFDVGQGSAIVIEANNAFIIYDTGPSFPSGFSMANTVLLPFFESQNRPHIDKLILSHLDNDHAGGKALLLETFNIKQVLSPNSGCQYGNNFTWQGLQFEVLWPTTRQSGHDNDHSCVLRIDDGTHSVLLPGDIEKHAEQALVSLMINEQGSLASSVLVAPHHGSKTSSSLAFIEAVKPQHVVFTAGYQNRWGFPLPQIVQRYQKIGATVSVSGNDGQISFHFSEQGIQYHRYRQDQYKRWFFQAPQPML